MKSLLLAILGLKKSRSPKLTTGRPGYTVSPPEDRPPFNQWMMNIHRQLTWYYGKK